MVEAVLGTPEHEQTLWAESSKVHVGLRDKFC